MRQAFLCVAIASGLHLLAIWQWSCPTEREFTRAQYQVTPYQVTTLTMVMASPTNTSMALEQQVEPMSPTQKKLTSNLKKTLQTKTKTKTITAGVSKPSVAKPINNTLPAPSNANTAKNTPILNKKTVVQQAVNNGSVKKTAANENTGKKTSLNESANNKLQSEAVEKNALEHSAHDYLSFVRTQILKHKRYPHQARLRRHQGSITVAFTLTAHGKIKNIQLISRSSSKYLNKSVAQLLRKIDLPPAEARIRNVFPKQMTLTLDFTLE